METYLVFAVLLWWAIEWVKRYMEKFELDEKVRELVILALALVGGIGMAIGYNLDLFVLLGVQESQSLAGQIFAGIGIASGSGGVFELLKAIQNIGNITITGEEDKPPSGE